MAGKILVGCKLPHGLQLKLTGSTETVTLNGQNQHGVGKEIFVLPAPFGTTEVDASFWEKWKKENAGLAMVKNGLIFEAPADKPAELVEKAKDSKKSGLEPIAKADLGKMGVAEKTDN